MLEGALIGCGFFARHHLHAWKQLPGVQIVALCDIDPQRLQQTAAEFGVARMHADARDLFASERLDFVDIVTTVNSHRALVEMAAAARVPCICQKPFASSLADAQAMVDACAGAGVPLMVHENFRWQTPIQAVRRAIDVGAIGKPFWGRFSFRSAFDVYRAHPYLAEGKRCIIEDLGIHILDIARFLHGDVATVSASTQRVNERIVGEDVATILLRHVNGATSIVDCSYASARAEELFPQTLIEIDACEGALRLDAGYRLTIHHVRDGTLKGTCEPPLHPWAERPWFNIQDSVVNIQAHWLECLREQREPQTSGRDNLKTLALVEAAYASAAAQQAAQRV
ncbi:MAG TPA: Gfo/Idh/MocA family oxidoreductase [Burkholderiaceae bacterium]|nr:Gfo/Idh/MocA family oxidoreductase [Burkholderiaceae bacterium]